MNPTIINAVKFLLGVFVNFHPDPNVVSEAEGHLGSIDSSLKAIEADLAAENEKIRLTLLSTKE